MSNSNPKLDSTAWAVEKTPRDATHTLLLTLSSLLGKVKQCIVTILQRFKCKECLLE